MQTLFLTDNNSYYYTICVRKTDLRGATQRNIDVCTVLYDAAACRSRRWLHCCFTGADGRLEREIVTVIVIPSGHLLYIVTFSCFSLCLHSEMLLLQLWLTFQSQYRLWLLIHP
jgi:hypothetical protein